eukprot:COSAG01_NODE_3628_length_5843_cov_9.101008_2_plen_322_part_00
MDVSQDRLIDDSDRGVGSYYNAMTRYLGKFVACNNKGQTSIAAQESAVASASAQVAFASSAKKRRREDQSLGETPAPRRRVVGGMARRPRVPVGGAARGDGPEQTPRLTSEQSRVMPSPTPGEAHSVARQLSLRPEWDRGPYVLAVVTGVSDPNAQKLYELLGELADAKDYKPLKRWTTAVLQDIKAVSAILSRRQSHSTHASEQRPAIEAAPETGARAAASSASTTSSTSQLEHQLENHGATTDPWPLGRTLLQIVQIVEKIKSIVPEIENGAIGVINQARKRTVRTPTLDIHSRRPRTSGMYWHVQACTKVTMHRHALS